MRSRNWWPLAAMMGLLYAVMGAFWPLLAVHLEDLGLEGRARGSIFATLALGAVLAPLGVGRVADRRVPIERLMAGIYLVGAVILAVIAGAGFRSAGVLFGLFLAYWLVVAPAHGLSATMALRNLDRPAEEFGGVRGMGTIGWMVAGWLTSIVMLLTGTTDRGKGAEEGLWLGAGLSVVLAVVAATWLPHTPPVAPAGGERRRADLSEAMRVLRRPAVALYLLMAFAVTLTTPYVYQVLPNTLQAWGLPRRWLAPAMSLGQVPEILSLLVLPKLLSRFGFVGTMAAGMGAYVIRYGSLILEPPLWVAVAGIPLHGIGVACFTIAGQMYLDRQAPPDRRAEAQGLNMVVTTGAGALLGSLLAGELVGRLGNDRGAIYWAPFAINLGCLVLWLGMSMRWARKASGETR